MGDSIEELIEEVEALDIRLWAEDGALRFNAPSGGFPDDLKRRVGERKTEIVAYLGRRGSAVSRNGNSIHVVPRDGKNRLSPAQERLWFLHRLEGCEAAYNITIAFHIDGGLDVSVLEKSVEKLLDRHEILRQSIVDRDGVPYFREADIAGSFERVSADASSIGVLVLREATTPFDLENGPLVRFRLFEVSSTEHILCINLHHIIGDGWSIDRIVAELSSIYRGLSAGRAPVLDPLPIQYIDVAARERSRNRGLDDERADQFWQKVLEGAPTSLELPLDRPRSAHPEFRGANFEWDLPAETRVALESLSTEGNASVFACLLSAFQLVLRAFSQQEDFLIGTPVANRLRPEVQDLVGFFVNTLVIRSGLGRSATFRELVAETRESVLGMLEHQDTPFERLLEISGVERDLSRSPLAQVFFSFNEPARLPEFGDSNVVPFAIDFPFAKFDLTLEVEPRGDVFSCRINYDVELFERSTIERIARLFDRVIAEALKEPDSPLNSFSLLPASDQERIAEWNQTAKDYDRSATLVSEFSAQVARTPDTIAIKRGASLTYRELDRRSNQIAHLLIERGIGRDVPVGVQMGRSCEMVAALLGVLKAGGAYLPLDPSYPSDRLTLMIEDSGCPVVLTDGSGFADCPDGVSVIDLADTACGVADQSAESPSSVHGPQDLAYLIYTSGSTGRPKGVMITHRNVVNFFTAMDDVIEVEPSVWLASTSISFDISVLEIFWTLARGFTVLIADNIEDSLPDLIESGDVTHFQCTPSHARMLLGDEGRRDAFSRLNKLLVGGEALPPGLLKELQSVCGGQIINMYGPTETTIWSTSIDVTRVEGSVTIGRPVANTTIRILDAQNRQVPIGVAGELCIGGDGVARGYFQRPELTTERFITDPIGGGGGGRLYRTGDLARWLPSGEIEFIGRNDFQVKIRGHRIELGEIEAALEGVDGIVEAVVVSRDGNDGLPMLVAYVRAAGVTAIDSANVREVIGSSLPDYMIPSAFVQLEVIPRTPNGKIDRGALPDPEFGAAADSVPTPPRDDVERGLATIWTELLGLEVADVHESFFSLGGHSLLVTRMLFRIREEFAAELPIRAVFEAPSISKLAERIRAASKVSAADQDSIPIAVDRSTFPAAFSQERLYFLDRLEGGGTGYNIPVAWRIRGPLVRQKLEQAIESLVASEEVFRTVLHEASDGLCQRVTPGVKVLLEFAAVTEAEIASAVSSASERVFDLETGPLHAWSLFEISETDHVLVLNHHHAISDRVSVGLIEERLGTFYRDETASKPGVAFGDVVAWQRQKWVDGSWSDQLQFWSKRFDTPVPPLSLPLDRARPKHSKLEGASLRRRLSDDVTSGLSKLGAAADTSFFTVALAAYGALLARLSGENEIVVGTPVANRNHPDLSATIGFLVNTLAIRLDLEGGQSIREWLTGCRNAALEAFENQDVPFDRVVEALKVDRDLSRHPLFQAMLVVDEEGPTRLDLGNVAVEPVDVPTTSSKFDLTFFLLRSDLGVELVAEYDSALFDEATIDGWIRLFENLVTNASTDLDRKLGEIDILPANERQNLLVEFNRTDRLWDSFLPVHEIVSRQAMATPDVTAVEDAEESLTYAELEERTNALAGWLIDAGIKQGALVGIYLPRSVGALVSILSVLKAGAAYVPLDCLSPPFRTRQILETCGDPLVLASDATSSDLHGMRSRVVSLNELPKTTEVTAASPQVSMSDLAYVIFTSGSTGLPKGVEVEHRGLSNYLLWAREAYRADEGAGSVIHSSLAFDLTITGLFLPLMCGKPVRMVPDGEQSFADLLTVLSRCADLSVLKLTPAHLDLLSHELPVERARVLCSHYVIGGENLFGSQLDWWQDNAPSARFINEYGPTETVVGCCVYDAGSDDRFPGSVPIGRPIANTRLYVLDEALRPVPRGVAGELFIAGHGVARGYLNQPELTARKFLEDPFAPSPGGRMYKTGDIVRMRADGNLEYLGRRDDQVKIRGFRVELAEIERAVREHPAVEEAAVVLRNGQVQERIDAFVTGANDGAAFDSRELIGWLGERLPIYMLPASVTLLEKLPLTVNGKVDRAALPVPEADESAGHDPDSDDWLPLERDLARIWASALSIPRLGIDDHFFELGGHSLLALRLVRRIQDELQIEVPIRFFFEHPTVRSMAARLEKSRQVETPASSVWRYLVPLQLKGDRRPLFLFPGGIGTEREFLVFARLAGFIGDDQPIFGLRATDAEGETPIHRTVPQMAEDYVREIRAMQPEGPYRFLGECVGGIVAFEAARQLAEQGEVVSHFILLDSDCPRSYDYALSRLSVAWLKFRRNWMVELFTRSVTHFFRLIRLRPSEGWEYIKNKGRMGMKRVDQAMLSRRQAVESELLTPSDHHYFRTLIRYRPQNYRGNICLMMSEPMAKSPRAMSWAEWVDGAIDVRRLEGDHFTYIRENAPKTAGQIREFLGEDR